MIIASAWIGGLILIIVGIIWLRASCTTRDIVKAEAKKKMRDGHEGESEDMRNLWFLNAKAELRSANIIYALSLVSIAVGVAVIISSLFPTGT